MGENFIQEHRSVFGQKFRSVFGPVFDFGRFFQRLDIYFEFYTFKRHTLA